MGNDVKYYENYSKVCEKAVSNHENFLSFKSDAIYNTKLEHVTLIQGKQYFDMIKKYNFNEYYFNKFLENDKIGNPKKYEFDDKIISPTTLRYLYQATDLFNKINIENLDIVEIGGGYGGLCKIITDLQEYFNIYYKSYTIIDLSSVIKLQNKYLKELGYEEINFIDYYEIKDINKKFDCCISNYGFGEFDVSVQDSYVEFIMKNCKHFYIIYNTPNTHNFILENNMYVEREYPMTGPYNKLYYK